MQKQESAMEETGTRPLKHARIINIQNDANHTFIFVVKSKVFSRYY